MKQVVGLTSTYSSDEFGVCSALFELGGMVVIHDASGCNSTYTTHDEPRWYDMDSMVYISALSEMEAIMGDDEKLLRDIITTAQKLQPEFIAVVGAPVPYMIGTDLDAVAMLAEGETGIPAFGFAANGMHDYIEGISMAFRVLTERFCTQVLEKTDRLSVNIIGATPLDYSINGSIDSIREWIEEHGMEVNSCFAMGSSLEELKQASAAHVNLVISYGGLAAARLLEERFGIPYMIGVPFGKNYADELAQKLRQTALSGISGHAAKKVQRQGKKTLALIGESVFSTSLATAIEMEYDVDIRVLVPLYTEDEMLRSGDLRTPEEDDIIEQLQSVDGVIADPLYRVICKTADFYELPHEAFSGRIYDDVNPNLINRSLQYREDTTC